MAKRTRNAGEAKFEAAFNTAGVPMSLSSWPGNKLVEVNDAFCETLGYERAELIGKTPPEIGLDIDPVGRDRLFDVLRKHGIARDIEVSLRAHDGRTVRGTFSASLIDGDADGEKLLLLSLVDMTERRAAEGALRASEARFAAAFESAGVMMLIVRAADGIIVDANRAFLRDTGYGYDEVVGRTTRDLRLFADPATGLQIAQEIREKGYVRGLETQVVNRAGEIVYALFSTDPIEIGGVPHLITTVFNTTQRRKAEDALRASEERYRNLVEQTADGVLLIDQDGRIVDTNPAMADHLGRTMEELRGTVWTDYIDADQLQDVPFIWPPLEAGKPVVFERRVRKPDGSVVELEVHARQFAQGWMLGTARDIGARKAADRERAELEDQLRQAQKMEAVGRLAGGIAHDFNNLLTAVNGYADLLITELGDSPLTDDAREIRRAGARAAELTRQVLAFARRQVLAPRAVDVNTVVGSVGQMLGRLIGEQVRLVMTLSPEPAVVMADPGQLEQVLVNLAINARDALPDGGTLEIGTSGVDAEAALKRGIEGPAVLLTVTDDGAGMDEATLAQAFEPFFTTKMAGSGTGLGLATVYGIVHQSHGEVWAESTPGHGTTVSVLLPRVDARPESGGGPEPVAADAAGKATVLVVEDEAAVRGFVVSTLERAGYRVLVAATPAEAIALTDGLGQPIDVLLTDMIMPEISGLILARRLVVSRPSMSVVLMSGYDPELSAAPVEGGFRFLAKPFGRDALIAAIAAAVSA
jgi:PAS domain S-box-containing protein